MEMSGYVENGRNGVGDGRDDGIYWRDKGVKDRLGYSLENDKLYKDIEFIVGEHEVRIQAHKLILRLSSLVFENLITSHEEQGLDEIKLPNTSPTMFRRLLKFIYSDELELFDLLHFFEVAREFGFRKLPEQTIRVLKKTEITADNAVLLLDIAKGLGDDQLEQASLDFIFQYVFIRDHSVIEDRSNAKDVLNSEEFVQVSYVSLCQLLMDDRLAIEELSILYATLRWGEFQCKKSRIPATNENVRAALKEARLLIRYTEMGYDQVLSDVKPSGILFTQEFVQVLKYFVDPTMNLLNIPTKPRGIRPNLQPKRPRIEDPHSRTSYTSQPQSQSIVSHAPPTMEDRAKEFLMQFCFIDYRDLLNAIQLRFTVHKITLHEVELRNADLGAGRRIFLPNLESFTFYQKKDPASRLPDRSFMRGLTTKEFLFFEKEKLGCWTFQDLWSLGIDININVKGLSLMELYSNSQNKGKRLTLSYPRNSESEQILNSLSEETNLTSLCLTACTIPSPEVLNASANSLQTLVLQGVEFNNSISATEFINQFKNLKNLSVFITNGITLNFQFHLLSQRATLERIALAKVNLGTYKKKKTVVPFAVCEEVYLDVCAWPPALGEHFSTLFPQLRRIFIRSKDTCRPSARFFTELLEIRTLQRIFISRYPGKEDTHLHPNLNIFVPPSGVNKSAVHHFLKKAGMDFSPTGVDVPDFILEKNDETNVWTVVYDQANEFDEAHFKFSLLNVFFSDSTTSKLID